MDRRLSGALAWGALLLIVGIPGFDMLNRRVDETAGVVTTPADGSAAPSWKSGSTGTDIDTASFGPLPQAATTDAANATDAGEDDSLPDVTLLASAPDAAASETLPAAPSPSIITLGDGVAPVAPTKIDTLNIDAVVTDVTTSPAAIEPAPEPEPTTTASPDSVSSVIASRVHDVLFSSPDATVDPNTTAATDETTPSAASADIGLRSTISPPSGSASSTIAGDDLAAVATAPLDFSTPLLVPPETIPYPAPALRRAALPVARTTLVPPEPVPEVRPDNAIFFGDWVNTPPKTAATGPGR